MHTGSLEAKVRHPSARGRSCGAAGISSKLGRIFLLVSISRGAYLFQGSNRVDVRDRRPRDNSSHCSTQIDYWLGGQRVFVAHKDEFPPLLQFGLHKMSEDELRALTVEAFPLSVRRKALWANFVALLGLLKQLKLPCDVWLDGSFLTEKIDPDDVDFVLDVAIHVIENATPAQEALLNKISKLGFKAVENLHSFLMFTAPAIHLQYAEGKLLHDQWVRDFGYSYVKRTPKGIAVLEVR